jgi:peptidoglycan/LPS O-acetylase OafA/YrhL
MGFPLSAQAHRFGWIGYLIGGQLLAAPSLDLRRFFARRALRIVPAYFVILAIYDFLPSWREYPDMFPLWKFLISVQNIGLRGGTAFSHGWSLAVEDQFYLMLPIILLLVVRRPRVAKLLPPPSALW